MSTTELKLEIINRIATIEDEMVLEEIYKLVDLESRTDTVYKLTDEERTAITIGLNDIKDGRVYSSEAAEHMIKEWLKR
ncbi:MAG: hypothetical protein K2U26_11495 [Cyclobacteriaceae bacterium]|nr:hypothetical protein [Cyclobacteriaceae bacterium]